MKNAREVSFGTVEKVGAEGSVTGEENSEEQCLRAASVEENCDDGRQAPEKPEIRFLACVCSFLVFGVCLSLIFIYPSRAPFLYPSVHFCFSICVFLFGS